LHSAVVLRTAAARRRAQDNRMKSHEAPANQEAPAGLVERITFRQALNRVFAQPSPRAKPCSPATATGLGSTWSPPDTKVRGGKRPQSDSRQEKMVQRSRAKVLMMLTA
jgi:hypothetical protein